VFRRFVKCESGATAVEYGLIASLIALGMIGGFGQAADAIGNLWGSNQSNIQMGLNK
jgi:pilus assembly protein Flp/PilA